MKRTCTHINNKYFKHAQRIIFTTSLLKNIFTLKDINTLLRLNKINNTQINKSLLINITKDLVKIHLNMDTFDRINELFLITKEEVMGLFTKSFDTPDHTLAIYLHNKYGINNLGIKKNKELHKFLKLCGYYKLIDDNYDYLYSKLNDDYIYKSRNINAIYNGLLILLCCRNNNLKLLYYFHDIFKFNKANIKMMHHCDAMLICCENNNVKLFDYLYHTFNLTEEDLTFCQYYYDHNNNNVIYFHKTDIYPCIEICCVYGSLEMLKYIHDLLNLTKEVMLKNHNRGYYINEYLMSCCVEDNVHILKYLHENFNLTPRDFYFRRADPDWLSEEATLIETCADNHSYKTFRYLHEVIGMAKNDVRFNIYEYEHYRVRTQNAKYIANRHLSKYIVNKRKKIVKYLRNKMECDERPRVYYNVDHN